MVDVFLVVFDIIILFFLMNEILVYFMEERVILKFVNF